MKAKDKVVYVAVEYDDLGEPQRAIAAFTKREDADACPNVSDVLTVPLLDGPAQVRTRYTVSYYAHDGQDGAFRVNTRQEIYDGDDEPEIEQMGPHTYVHGWSLAEAGAVAEKARKAASEVPA